MANLAPKFTKFCLLINQSAFQNKHLYKSIWHDIHEILTISPWWDFETLFNFLQYLSLFLTIS